MASISQVALSQPLPSSPSLQQLVDLFVKHQNIAEGFPTGTHAGIAMVLEVLIDAAQARAAADLQHYDHRSLYAFAAALREQIRPFQLEKRGPTVSPAAKRP